MCTSSQTPSDRAAHRTAARVGRRPGHNGESPVGLTWTENESSAEKAPHKHAMGYAKPAVRWQEDGGVPREHLQVRGVTKINSSNEISPANTCSPILGEATAEPIEWQLMAF